MTHAALVLSLGIALGAQGPPPDEPGVHEIVLDLDGQTIRALCTDGARRVALWHDEGDSSEAWRPVLERLDGRVGACAFDRRGSGGSSAAPGYRGWYELVDELRRIHLALGFDRGYVVAAHGLGGLYARAYAAERRGDVAGLVLIDPAHEDMLEQMSPGLPKSVLDARRSARRTPNTDGVVRATVEHRVRVARLPDVPVTVVTATIRPDGDGFDARFLGEAARRVHASILGGVTHRRHLPAQMSGHDVQRDQPGLVTDEILRVTRIAGR